MSPPPQASASWWRRASAAARCSDLRPPADHRGTAAPRPGDPWRFHQERWEKNGKMGDLTIKDGGFTWLGFHMVYITV